MLTKKQKTVVHVLLSVAIGLFLAYRLNVRLPWVNSYVSQTDYLAAVGLIAIVFASIHLIRRVLG